MTENIQNPPAEVRELTLTPERKEEFIKDIATTAKLINEALRIECYGHPEAVLSKAHDLSILTANSAVICGKAKALLMFGKHMRLEELKGMNLTATLLREDLNSYCWNEYCLVEYTEQLAKNIRASIDLLRSDLSKYKEELIANITQQNVP